MSRCTFSNNLFRQAITVVFLTVFISLTACSKRKCKRGGNNNGIIVNEVSTRIRNKISSDGVVILDSASFKQVVPHDTIALDLNTYSILGIETDGGGCDVSADREVTKLDNEKQYHYTVHIYACGICKKLWTSSNLVTVPKLPNGWTVTFEVKRN